MSETAASGQTAENEVARICRELIRFDTSNFGDNSGPGERAAAEYTAGLIEEAGLTAAASWAETMDPARENPAVRQPIEVTIRARVRRLVCMRQRLASGVRPDNRKNPTTCFSSLTYRCHHA